MHTKKNLNKTLTVRRDHLQLRFFFSCTPWASKVATHFVLGRGIPFPAGQCLIVQHSENAFHTRRACHGVLEHKATEKKKKN